MQFIVLCTESCSLRGFGAALEPVKHKLDFSSPRLAPERPALSLVPKPPSRGRAPQKILRSKSYMSNAPLKEKRQK